MCTKLPYLIIWTLNGCVVVQIALALDAVEALLVVPRALRDHLLSLEYLIGRISCQYGYFTDE